MTTARRAAAAALLIAVALTGCGTDDSADQTPAPAEPSAAAGLPGLPPAPDAATQDAYVAALKKIDPDIVGDKDTRALVNRGRDTCTTIAETQDEAELIAATNQRFTAPGHPDGFGEAKAKRILAAVRQYICP